MTEAGRLCSLSGCKVIWCFVHVCVGVNKTFYLMCALSFIESRIYKSSKQNQTLTSICNTKQSWKIAGYMHLCPGCKEFLCC